MSDGISLLPEELRKKEEELKKSPRPPSEEDKLKMYIPKAEEEDIEIIEVDEGEIGEVLEGEPLVARILFKTQSFFEEVKSKLFESRVSEAPPKLPPQFFKPPTKKAGVTGLVPTAGGAAQIQPGKARIMPSAQAPRRVRVIRRVRKPVQVSFIDENASRIRVDISRRRFTLIFMAMLFLALIGGGYGLLYWQGDRASANLTEAMSRLSSTQGMSQERLSNWESFRDLEPRLKALTQVLDRHLSPSRLFDALEENTVPDVFYSTFTLSPDGRLILGTTAPSFASAARQIVAFETSGIAQSVQAMGYQAHYNDAGNLEAVMFQIGLALNPDILRTIEPIPQPVASR
ncbi:MAG: hypothetical protein WC787_02515 [Patescibacteria group bacterium]|jgi:hypothetical protein